MNLKYHVLKFDVMCPFCDIVQNDCEINLSPGSREVMECYLCDKKFSVQMDYVFSTHSLCTENGLEHEFYESHIKNFFMCHNCEACERRSKENELTP